MKLSRPWKLPRIDKKTISTERLALCAFFLFGVLAGHLFAAGVPASSRAELSGYLLHYANGTAESLPIGGVLFAYFRGAAVFWVLGLLSYGIWLVPAYMVFQGGMLSFAVHCFVASLGRGGLWLAFAAFGVRCLFILPCCFFLAGRSWRRCISLRRGRRPAVRVKEEKDALLPLLVCAVVLLIGCVVELSLVPRLFRWALMRYF